MSSRRTVMAVLALVLQLALASGCNGCTKDEPKSTRWDDAAAAATAAPTGAATGAPATSSAPVPTGAFNKFFPKEGEGGNKRVFAADKEGFAEAKLQKDGKDVAVLSISDADRVPGAKAKFEGATEKVEGFPVMKVGNNQTTALVKDRYQVKVSSPTLDHEARKAVLATFDLKGLSAL